VSLDVFALLRQRGAILEGHFRLTSGRHSPTYLEKFRILEQPDTTAALCELIAQRFGGEGVSVVAGPTTGGIILSYEVARQLGLRGIFAEPARTSGRDEGGRSFQRGFRLKPDERVLVVDDILTTGGSIREVLQAVKAAGAKPIGVAVLVDRAAGTVDFGLPFFACLTLEVPSYPPEECPLCAKGVPLIET